MLGTIGYNLKRLTDFSGREARAIFWPYVGALVVVTMIATTLAMLPMIGDTFAKMQRFAAEHPELSQVEQGPGHYSITIQGYHPELMPDFGLLFAVIAAVTMLFVALVAAAAARRLHDRGRSGAWGLMPLPFLATGLVLVPGLMANFAGSDAGEPDFALFGLLFLNNLVYLATLITLIVLLAGPGTAGPNRFGDAAA